MQHPQGGCVQHLPHQCCGKQVHKRCPGHETEGRQFDDKGKRLENAKLADPEYYRKGESLNAIGFYLKPGDEV